MVFIAEDIGEDGVTVIGTLCIGDEAHGNTCYRFLDLDACIHECKAAAADRSHGGRAVGLEDIGNYAYCVREFRSRRDNGLESAHGKVSVADFAASGAAQGLCLTCCERREVVVENELLVVLDEDLVHLLHVHLGAKGDGSKGLGFTTGEDGAAVCAGEVVYLAPDRTHLIGGAAVKALSFIENEVTHSLFLYIVIVTVDHCALCLEVFL